MKRTRQILGTQLRYTWKTYLTPEQDHKARKQIRMVNRLWNAMLELDNLIRGHGVWIFDKDAGGPVFADLEGRLYIVKLLDVVTRRGLLGEYSSRSPLRIATQRIIPDDPADKSIRTRLPSEIDRGYWVTSMLRECPEWRELSTWTPRRVATSLAAAWKSLFTPARNRIPGKKYGPPRFKILHKHLSLPHRCRTPGSSSGGSGCSIQKSDRHKNSWRIYLAGISDETVWKHGKGQGDIWARGELPVNAKNERPTKVNEWQHADLMYRGGAWWFSVAVALDRHRHPPGPGHVTVEFGRIGCVAFVDGIEVRLSKIDKAQNLDEKRTTKQASLDLRFPRGASLSPEDREARKDLMREINRMQARIARMRREALHEWTTSIIRRAASLTIIFPSSVLENTRSPRGDAKSWGAEVKPVSELNRSTLFYAPYAAKQMLLYKAKEIGIRCDVVADTSPEVAVGEKLVAAGKAVRKVQRAIRRIDNGRNQQRTRSP